MSGLESEIELKDGVDEKVKDFIIRTGKKDNTLDDILRYYSGYGGCWQYGIIILMSIANPTTLAFGNFVTATHEHRCRGEASLEAMLMAEKLTFDQINRVITEPDSSGCSMFNVTAENWSTALNLTVEEKRATLGTQSCQRGYIFKQQDYFYNDTIVKEFSLICSNSKMMPLDNFFYSAGISIGFILGGFVADYMGRRYSAIIFSLVAGASAIGMYFIKLFIPYCLLRLSVAMAGSAIASTTVIMCIELSTVESRSKLLALSMFIPYFLSQSHLSFLAWFIKDWRTLQLVHISPMLLALLYFCILHESPRWLYQKGKFDEMKRVFHSAKRVNQRFFGSPRQKFHFDLEVLFENIQLDYQAEKEKTVESQTVLANFRSWVGKFLTRNSLMLTTMMSLNYFALFGVGYYLKYIKESIYITNVILSLSNCVCSGLLIVTEKIFSSRKFAIIVYLNIIWVLTVAFALVTMLVEMKTNIPLISVIFIVSIMLQTTLCIQSYYVSELYPASLRNQSLGYVLGIGRLSVVFIDYVVLLDKYSHGLPLLIHGIAVVVNMFMVKFFLADTSGDNLDAKNKR